MNRLSQKRLVDRLMEAYVSWREACLRVSETYGCWVRETGPGAGYAFSLYMTALDQEECAAELYARLVRRAGQLIPGEDHAVDQPGQAAKEVGSR
jgi:hypothetical protein